MTSVQNDFQPSPLFFKERIDTFPGLENPTVALGKWELMLICLTFFGTVEIPTLHS